MALSTFMGLETNLRGLLAQQQALDVTSHNIANASTPGYSRQVAVLVASPAYAMPGVSTAPAGAGQLGTGVDVASYQRMRDSFLDVQYRAQSMLQGQAQTTEDGLQQVQLAFNEPTDSGISSLLSNYWGAWQNLSNNPEDMGTRQALAQSAASLADGFTSLSSQLSTLQTQTGQNVGDTLTEVNSYGSSDRHSSTSRSARRRSTGTPPTTCSTSATSCSTSSLPSGTSRRRAGANGSVEVSFGGASLVTDGTSSTLAESDLTGLTSGNLEGLITLRDTTIPGYQAQLNTIASTLITQTNAQSAAGFDLNGNTGGAFFTGTDASNIAVNPAIVSNPSLIAASATGAVGDAGNALAIADMQNTNVIGSSTIDSAYTQLVTQVGSDVQQATNQVDTTTSLVNALQNQRQSVSGVEPRRGDDESHHLSARLSGISPRAERDRRHARSADQPHREGRAVTERITQNMMNQTLLYDLQNVTTQLSTSEQELSSGYKLNQPSDDPYGTSQALKLRADLASNQQYQSNVNDANSWQTVADTALGDIGDSIERARDLVIQGANDTNDASDRAAIVTELTSSSTRSRPTRTRSRAASTSSPARRRPPSRTSSAPTTRTRATPARSTARSAWACRCAVNQPGSSIIGDSSSGLLSHASHDRQRPQLRQHERAQHHRPDRARLGQRHVAERAARRWARCRTGSPPPPTGCSRPSSRRRSSCPTRRTPT